MTGFVPIAPVPKGRPRMTRNGHAYTPATTRAYEQATAQILAIQAKRHGCAEGPLAVHLTFWLPRPKTVRRLLPAVRPDLDNYVKAFCDAADGLLWGDDGQIVDLRAKKRYATPPDEPVGTAWTIHPATEEAA